MIQVTSAPLLLWAEAFKRAQGVNPCYAMLLIFALLFRTTDALLTDRPRLLLYPLPGIPFRANEIDIVFVLSELLKFRTDLARVRELMVGSNGITV